MPSASTKLAKPGQVFAPGLVKRLHVDQQAVKDGDCRCILIQNVDGPWRCQIVELLGASTIAADFEHPLDCGARVWIETHHGIKVLA